MVRGREGPCSKRGLAQLRELGVMEDIEMDRRGEMSSAQKTEAELVMGRERARANRAQLRALAGWRDCCEGGSHTRATSVYTEASTCSSPSSFFATIPLVKLEAIPVAAAAATAEEEDVADGDADEVLWPVGECCCWCGWCCWSVPLPFCRPLIWGMTKLLAIICDGCICTYWELGASRCWLGICTSCMPLCP